MWWSSRHDGKDWDCSEGQGWNHHCQGFRGDYHYNWKLLGDRYPRKNSPIEGELVLGLCLNLSHLWRWKDVRSVYGIQQEGQGRDLRFVRRVAGKAVGQGDVRLKFRLPRNREHEVVVSDVLHVKGAHNSLSQSRLMNRGLWIVPVNGFGIKIYAKVPAMGTGSGGQWSLVAMAQHVGRLSRFDVDVKVAGKGCWSRHASRDRWYTAPNAIPNGHTYTDILAPEELTYPDILEPEETKAQDILVPIVSTPAIKRPAADDNSKGGNSGGGNSAGQMKDRMGSSDEKDDEDEDEDNPPAVIDKSKKTSFTRELAGVDRKLGRIWEAPASSHRRSSQTDHRRRRSGRLQIESAEADWPVQARALDIVLRIRCDFGDGILSFFVSWENNCFRGSAGLINLRRISGFAWSVRRSLAQFIASGCLSFTVVIPPWRNVGQTLSVVIMWC